MPLELCVAYDHQKIEDYVANRLSSNDVADFEAEITVDAELQKEVARIILKKMIFEKKIREEIEKAEKEKSLFLPKQLCVIEKNRKSNVLKKWWYNLSACLASS